MSDDIENKIRKDVQSFWDQLFSKDILLRFSVTDKDAAMKHIASGLGNEAKEVMPGLMLKEVIIHDTSARSKEMMDEIFAIVRKYQ